MYIGIRLSAPEALAELICSELNRKNVKAERRCTSIIVHGDDKNSAATYNVNIAFFNSKLLEHMSIIQELERESGQDVPQSGTHLRVLIDMGASDFLASQNALVEDVLRTLKGAQREYGKIRTYYFPYSNR